MRRTSVPLPITGFVGRGEQLAAVLQCLAAARLVIHIGVGGGGKSRLDPRVAEEALEDYHDDAWLLKLQHLNSNLALCK